MRNSFSCGNKDTRDVICVSDIITSFVTGAHINFSGIFLRPDKVKSGGGAGAKREGTILNSQMP